MPVIKSRPYIPKGAPLKCRFFHKRFVAILVDGQDLAEVKDCPKIAYWLCATCDRMIEPRGH